MRIHMTISPQSWGLERSQGRNSIYLDQMGIPAKELELRAQENTRTWLMKQFNSKIGAFYGYYDPRSKKKAAPQTANLIAPFQLLAAHDRYDEEQFLKMARRSANWMEVNMVESHPMSLVLGGVRDDFKPSQLWTKYTADYVTLNLALYERLEERELLRRAIHGSKFLIQSQNHGFSPKYDHNTEKWAENGWQSFGRVIVAMSALQEISGEEAWLDRALLWAEHGLSHQHTNGCFCLINRDYYSSDIAADELRALVRVYWRTNRSRYLDSAVAFADWHLKTQCGNGAWPLAIDRWGTTVCDYIGPGDVPNISTALLLVHKATQDTKYLVSAAKAIRYSVAQQCVPGGDGPYNDDPMCHWGFWSWDPRYDYTLSSDQSTHHVRGYWFFLDYFFSLPEKIQAEVAERVGPPSAPIPRLGEEHLGEAK